MPLLVGHGGTVREVGEPGRLLGLSNPYEWHDQEVAVAPGETLVLYTDGVTDTRGEQQRFGDARLHELLTAAGASSPAQLLASLDGELASFQVGAQADDTAVIAMRLDPAAARPQSTKGSVSATPESSKTRWTATGPRRRTRRSESMRERA
jgi:serine phosphatase RsbU (regulator of sigma subunit)